MRKDIIHDILEHHYHGIGSAASSTTIEVYRKLPASPTKHIGIYGPIPYPAEGVEPKPSDPPILMGWSPEYLDKITGELSDELLDHYLRCLCYFGDMMIALEYDIPDQDERYRSIEIRFVEEWPESLEVMNMVELKALDLISAGEF